MAGIYAPVMLMPQVQQVSPQTMVDMMNQCNINNQRKESNQNTGFQSGGSALHNVSELGKSGPQCVLKFYIRKHSLLEECEGVSVL